MTKKKIIAVLATLICICSVGYLIYTLAPNVIAEIQVINLRAKLGLDVTNPNIAVTNAQVKEAKAQNPECVAWLKIPSKDISYPVMQTTDNDKYMHKNFDGSTFSWAGSLFLDYRAHVHGTNKLIYGHHLSTGTMFSSLAKAYDQNVFNTIGDAEYSTVDQPMEVYRPIMAARIYETYEPVQRFSDMSQTNVTRWLKEMKSAATAFSDTVDFDIEQARSVLITCCCSEDRVGQPWRCIVVFVR